MSRSDFITFTLSFNRMKPLSMCTAITRVLLQIYEHLFYVKSFVSIGIALVKLIALLKQKILLNNTMLMHFIYRLLHVFLNLHLIYTHLSCAIASTSFCCSILMTPLLLSCPLVSIGLPAASHSSALCNSAAHTVESTPPLTITSTFFVGPTSVRISSIHARSRLSIVYFPAILFLFCFLLCFKYKPLHIAMLNKKFCSITRPLSVRSTSGWNCSPYKRRASLPIAEKYFNNDFKNS
jgi:hypothetical protein